MNAAPAPDGSPAACRRSARTARRRDRRRARRVSSQSRGSPRRCRRARRGCRSRPAAAEHRRRRREGGEIALDRDLRLAGHDARAHLRRHGFEMHAERVDAGGLQPLEPGVVVGRLALRLDRQIDRGLHRRRALAEDRGAAVAPARRAGRHHHVLDAVELDGGLGDFGELRRRLALDGAAGRERLADGAELAGLGAALDSGCRSAAPSSPARRGRAARRSANRARRRRSAGRRSAAVAESALRPSASPSRRMRLRPPRPASRRHRGCRRPARCGPAPSR